MNIRYLVLIGCVFLLFSCEEKQLEPISPDKGKPAQVEILDSESMPGGVRINFRAPNDENILGVKAVYTRGNGRQAETSVSYYNNELIIEGYDDDKEHVVEIYTVSRSQSLSDPVKVSFTPLENPLHIVSRTVSITPDFAGVKFSWDNEYNALLTFTILTEDSVGALQSTVIYASQQKKDRRIIRGFDAVPKRFALLINDKWDNVSDTIFPDGKFVTPLKEMKLDKSKMSIVRLGGDAVWTSYNGSAQGFIDDVMITNNSNTQGAFAHSAFGSLPAAVTINLGGRYLLSRMVLHQHAINEYAYAWGNPEKFEIHIMDSTPSSNGNWDEWTRFANVEIIKPSSIPGNTISDMDAALAGDEIIFDELVPVQYVRLKFIQSWALDLAHVGEVTFYGDVAN